METSDTKLALDEIKLNLEKFSNRIIKILPLLAFLGTVLMVIFTLLSQVIFGQELFDHIIFLTPDIYTLISILGLQLSPTDIVSSLLASFTIIFSLALIATTVIILYKYYEMSKNFWSLAKVDVALKLSKKVYRFLIIYISFIAISYIIPSFGWIISVIFANISLFIAFFFFHKVLKKYGLRLQLQKDTAFFIGLSSLINIVAVCLVFVDISFLLLSLLGYPLLYLGLKKFNKQIQNIAPIVRDAPPPPTIAAPVGPAPRPTLGGLQPDVTDDIPSPTDQ